MKPRVLLVNPPIYDFSAYDFWLKPYGLLAIGGFLRGQIDCSLFDYLDRWHPSLNGTLKSDRFARGPFLSQGMDKPTCLAAIPRCYHRFGLARDLFQNYLQSQPAFDVILVQTMMTYWYPGVREVIEDLRTFCPQAKIVLGGNYVTLCPNHAQTLEADHLLIGTDLSSLWKWLNLTPDLEQPGHWELYPTLPVGALKLTEGCPFRCSYCAVRQVYGSFQARSSQRCQAEFDLLRQRGVKHIAFYDDALLFQADKILLPFLKKVQSTNGDIQLHSPNALNARFLTADLARRMVAAGFTTFYLGFESASATWQQATGNKVHTEELAHAVNHLRNAGVPSEHITAYQILGHPHQDSQELEASLHYVHSLGIRGTLADYSPIPGTPDGDCCSQWVDMIEPLMHNKTAFPILTMGFDKSNQFKNLQKQLNRDIQQPPSIYDGLH